MDLNYSTFETFVYIFKIGVLLGFLFTIGNAIIKRF